MKKIYLFINKQISFYVLFLLVIFIPFQSLTANILEAHTKLSLGAVFWMTHWYEFIILLFISYALYEFIILLFKSIYYRKINWSRLFSEKLIAVLLVVYGLVSVVFQKPMSLGIEGFRFALFSILIYIFTSTGRVGFDKARRNTLLKLYLILAVIIGAFGIIEKIFLPGNYWSLWGIVNNGSTFGYGWHTVVGIKQLSSFLGGPNQTASYLLPAFFIFVFLIIQSVKIKDKVHTLSYFILALILCTAIFLTYSRSAAIGLAVTFLVVPFLAFNKNWMKVIVSLLIALFFAIVIGKLALYNPDIITHGSSQSEHLSSLGLSLDTIKDWAKNSPAKLLIGGGLGTAGPIALKYGSGQISESWYLQLILELGIVGFLLWLVFIIYIINNLFRNNEFGLGLGMIAVSIAALFLHTWADNPAMAYTVMILIGAFLTDKANMTYKTNKTNRI